MKSNKNRLSFQAQLSRHSHDLSAGYSSSMTTGQIIPQYFHILSPGDKIYNDVKLFARLQNVVTAFLGEIDLHVDAFFVPLQMLYTPFGQMFAQTNDYISSLFATQNLDNKDGWPLWDVDASTTHFTPNEILFGHTECKGKEYTRLFNALDLNPFYFLNSGIRQDVGYTGDAIADGFCHQPNISPFIPAAYQAIYQKYFRNDEFEKLRVDSYNFDKFYASASFASLSICRLNYVQRPKDYFTETRVSPLFSAVNASWSTSAQDEDSGGLVPNSNFSINKVLDYLGASDSGFFEHAVDAPISGGTGGSGAFSASSVGSFSDNPVSSREWLNTANIRALFAIDKFARIYGRADKTYDAQILAHFGIEIPHDVKHDLTHIGHWHAVLQSDPIYGTGNAVNASDEPISLIGQVGGQGQCTLNSGRFDFKAPVHGVFMVVAYVVTKPRYIGTFSKLHLVTDRLHLPIPEFDKLGAQPLYYFEFNPSNLDTSVSGMISARAGWQNRYQEFKKKYNRASLSYNGANYTPQYFNDNIFAPWLISRLAFDDDFVIGPDSSSFVSPARFFEKANALDGIMVRTFVKGWSNSWFKEPHLMFQSDPIISEFYNDAKLVSWMSETGEPDL